MSFNGCGNFNISGGTFNNVKGNQNTTINNPVTHNRGSYNTYNTTTYGDGGVITHGGENTINMGGSRRGKKNRTQRYDYDYDSEEDEYDYAPRRRPGAHPMQNRYQQHPQSYPRYQGDQYGYASPPNGRQQWEPQYGYGPTYHSMPPPRQNQPFSNYPNDTFNYPRSMNRGTPPTTDYRPPASERSPGYGTPNYDSRRAPPQQGQGYNQHHDYDAYEDGRSQYSGAPPSRAPYPPAPYPPENDYRNHSQWGSPDVDTQARRNAPGYYPERPPSRENNHGNNPFRSRMAQNAEAGLDDMTRAPTDPSGDYPMEDENHEQQKKEKEPEDDKGEEEKVKQVKARNLQR